LTKRLYFQTTFMLFVPVGTIHLVRAVSGWTLIIGDYELPIWLSYAAGIFLLYLSTHAYRYYQKSK
jgi:hypothetical protein